MELGIHPTSSFREGEVNRPTNAGNNIFLVRLDR